MTSLILRLTVLLVTFSSGVAVSQILTRNRTVSQTVVSTADPIVVPVVEPALPPIPSIPENNAKKIVIRDFDPNRFLPDGSYVILGKMPKDFAEFQFLYIETYESKDGHRTGDLFIGSKDSDRGYEQQPAVFAVITDKRLLLVTEANATGIGYRFDGEFLQGNVVADAEEGKAVIKGTLTKTRNGRRTAECVVKFQIEQHGC
jgi:hypothetical protein